jgi:TetR/AcrR family transcriptional regulator, copper-responsive repressor
MKTADASSAKPRGRPRSFDREQALERAMQVFWKQGYEATSIHDLTRAMGINPPSLYAAFGDKERLFMEAVERYQRECGPAVACILDEAPSARAALERLLMESAGQKAHSGDPRGCMLITSATNCSAPSVQLALAGRREDQQAALKARIDRGAREGELPRGTDTAALADFYTTVLQGMAIRARDGATRKSLLAAAAAAMRAWPKKIEKNRGQAPIKKIGVRHL